MIATFVNALAVVVGTLIGRVSGKRIGNRFRHTVFSGIGVVSLLLGITMALDTQRILYLVLSLVVGGLIGAAIGVEDAIFAFGEWLKRRFHVSEQPVTERSAADDHTAERSESGGGAGGAGAAGDAGDAATIEGKHGFAEGFLVASVLFCVGALTIIGSFQAGVEQDYSLIFTKSVMDGFMAILLATAYGVGVGFSALSILVYQGGLTLLAGLLAPYVSPLMLSEISGVGGAMVVMIGINLLDLRTIKTGDFLPGIVLVVLFVLLDPFFSALL